MNARIKAEPTATPPHIAAHFGADVAPHFGRKNQCSAVVRALARPVHTNGDTWFGCAGVDRGFGRDRRSGGNRGDGRNGWYGGNRRLAGFARRAGNAWNRRNGRHTGNGGNAGLCLRAALLQGAHGVEGFARGLFVLAGRRDQLIHGFQRGADVNTFAAQALDCIVAGFFYGLTCLDGGLHGRLRCSGGGIQRRICGVPRGLDHAVVAFCLRPDQFGAGAFDFGQGALKLALALEGADPVFECADHARGQVQRTAAHRQTDFALDGAVFGRGGATVHQAYHLHRQGKQHQHRQRDNAAQDHAPPGGSVNEVAGGFEHDG
jgi:hypothetical protein